MKILAVQTSDDFLRPYHTPTERHIEKIKEAFPGVEFHVVKHLKDEIDKHLDCDIMIAFEVDGVDFEKAVNLKWLHLTSAGADHLPESVLNSDILITASTGVAPIPISEHVFAMLLAFGRNLHISLRNQMARKWLRDVKLSKVSEIRGKTIGIVGLGRVGRKVVEVARGFNMKVLGVDKILIQKEGLVDESYTPDELDKALESSDYVVLCLPLTKETYHLIDYERLKRMKPSAYLINIGRGKVVNETDLIRALKGNVIAGAGLDVFEEEPLLETSELWDLENVIITPHYAGLTPYYGDRVFDIFSENLEAFLENRRMPNLVGKETDIRR